MMTVLFLSGCATSRKASEHTAEATVQERADSLQTEVREVWTEAVPTAEARLEIPLVALSTLPQGAEYRAKNGRASATVQAKGDTIVVYATCDSLQRLCERYERQASTYKAALEQEKKDEQTTKEQRSTPVRGLVVALIAGVATGITITILTRKIWQKQY